MPLIAFDSPAALALLAVPLVVAWLAVRRPRADEEATGTLRLWREVAPAAPERTRRGARPPVALWLLVAALCAAVLALAGPRLGTDGARAEWRFVVDRSPSMYLVEDGRTRIELALELARESTGGSSGTWLAVAGGEVVAVADGEFPEAWLDAPRGHWSAPDWSLFDQPGCVWVTDAVPQVSRSLASVAAGGGRAVPGRVAVDGVGAWEWDGSDLRRAPEPARRALLLDERLDGSPLARAAHAWAQARRVAVVTAGSAELELRTGGSGEARPVSCGSAGWSQTGQARDVAALEGRPSITLLECDGRCVARAASGELVVGWESQSEPDGDGAAFALFWARAFDEWITPGGISLDERQAAGERSWSAGAPAERETGAPRGPAVLATAAALLALVSLCARSAS